MRLNQVQRFTLVILTVLDIMLVYPCGVQTQGSIKSKQNKDTSQVKPAGQGSSTQQKTDGSLSPEPPVQFDLAVGTRGKIQFRLVVGNHTELANLPIKPYYIALTPVTVGMLRNYAASHPSTTSVPDNAKDEDPLSAVYYADALGIASMLGCRVPTETEWINAYGAKLIAAGSDKGLVVVDNQLATAQDDLGFGNTYLSSKIAIYTRPNKVNDPPAPGILRLVRDVAPTKAK